MSSQPPNWDDVEQAIKELRNDLRAKAATLDDLTVQVKKGRDGAETVEPEQSPIDCMDQIAKLLNQRMDRIDQGLTEIHTKMLATRVFTPTNIPDTRLTFPYSEFNNVARVQNSHLDHHRDVLASFHNAVTNEPIVDFPCIVEDLYAMDLAAINSLLHELGESPTTNLPDGQEKVRKFLGMKHITVWPNMRVQGFS